MRTTSPHTCREPRDRTRCEACMQLEVALWDAINHYAITAGADPSAHVYGNTSRMKAVGLVGQVVDEIAARWHRDTLAADHVHLLKLYAESRDYVHALVDERDALVEASRRDSAEIEKLGEELQEARTALAAPELHWECQQKIDSLEMVVARSQEADGQLGQQGKERKTDDG